MGTHQSKIGRTRSKSLGSDQYNDKQWEDVKRRLSEVQYREGIRGTNVHLSSDSSNSKNTDDEQSTQKKKIKRLFFDVVSPRNDNLIYASTKKKPNSDEIGELNLDELLDSLTSMDTDRESIASPSTDRSN